MQNTVVGIVLGDIAKVIVVIALLYISFESLPRFAAWGWGVIVRRTLNYEVAIVPLQGNVLHKLGEWLVVGVFFSFVPEGVSLPPALDIIGKLLYDRSYRRL
jgi:hypothetical protein